MTHIRSAIGNAGIDHHLSRRQVLGGLLAGAAGAWATAGDVPSAIANELGAQGKQLLIVTHNGGLSQLESWDPKPGADTAGPLQAISTSVPGIEIAEWLPYTAQQMHHLTLLRSLSTGENDHGPGAYLMTTGRRIQSGFMYPTLPCWATRALTPARHPVPGYVTIGDPVKEAAFLGARYEPVTVKVGQPIPNLDRPDYLTDTAAARRARLRALANARFQAQRGNSDTEAYALSYDQARQLVQNKKMFDISDEPARDQERYGTHEMGKQCLLARRLINQDVTCVRVMHYGYDTHAENFNVHLDLLEQFDRPFACLIEDLAKSGRLANTLVVVMGEFGRTPGINTRMGRDHWSSAWSAAFAGLGIAAGTVVGKTNANGTEVTDVKTTAPDLFHTMLTALGIEPTEPITVEGQEIPLADPAGVVISELLA